MDNAVKRGYEKRLHSMRLKVAALTAERDALKGMLDALTAETVTTITSLREENERLKTEKCCRPMDCANTDCLLYGAGSSDGRLGDTCPLESLSAHDAAVRAAAIDELVEALFVANNTEPHWIHHVAKRLKEGK